MAFQAKVEQGDLEAWMRRRFIDRDIWQADVFVELSPLRKALWFYLWSTADEAGTFEFSGRLASAFVGAKVTEEDVASLPGLMKLPAGRWFIRSLIRVEYEELKETVRPHQKAIRLVAQFSLSGYLSDTYAIGMAYHKEEEGEEDQEGEGDLEKDQEGGTGGAYPPESRVALFYLNEKSGRLFHENAKNLGMITARLKEPGVTIDGVRMMIDRQCKKWLNTSMADYLRPPTLFNSEKFDGYYASREQPINHEHDQRNHKPTVSEIRNSHILGADASGSKAVAVIAARRERDEREAQARKAKAAGNGVAAQVAGPGGNAP